MVIWSFRSLLLFFWLHSHFGPELFADYWSFTVVNQQSPPPQRCSRYFLSHQRQHAPTDLGAKLLLMPSGPNFCGSAVQSCGDCQGCRPSSQTAAGSRRSFTLKRWPGNPAEHFKSLIPLFFPSPVKRTTSSPPPRLLIVLLAASKLNDGILWGRWL